VDRGAFRLGRGPTTRSPSGRDEIAWMSLYFTAGGLGQPRANAFCYCASWRALESVFGQIGSCEPPAAVSTSL